MGLFNPRSREEQAHSLYCENARFQEILRENKRKSEVRLNLRFWSEGQDLNLRPLPPQGRLEHFSGHFIFFQIFPLRQKRPFALSWHLVSRCSNRVYGRVCGRKNPLPNRWLRPHRERMIFYNDLWSTDVVASRSFSSTGLSYCNSSSAGCQECLRLKFAPQ